MQIEFSALPGVVFCRGNRYLEKRKRKRGKKVSGGANSAKYPRINHSVSGAFLSFLEENFDFK